MVDILYRIYAMSISLLFMAFTLYIFALAASPRLRQKNREWNKKFSPKIHRITEAIIDTLAHFIIFWHDSLISTVLFVFATSAIYDEVYPMFRDWQGWRVLYNSIERGFLMNPFPYYFFGFILFIWLFGFVIKRSIEDDEKKLDDAIKNAIAGKLGIDTKTIIDSVKNQRG